MLSSYLSTIEICSIADRKEGHQMVHVSPKSSHPIDVVWTYIISRSQHLVFTNNATKFFDISISHLNNLAKALKLLATELRCSQLRHLSVVTPLEDVSLSCEWYVYCSLGPGPHHSPSSAILVYNTHNTRHFGHRYHQPGPSTCTSQMKSTCSPHPRLDPYFQTSQVIADTFLYYH